jgi:hypothetical protein
MEQFFAAVQITFLSKLNLNFFFFSSASLVLSLRYLLMVISHPFVFFYFFWSQSQQFRKKPFIWGWLLDVTVDRLYSSRASV